MYYSSQTASEAILAQKVVYLGSSFLQLFILLSITNVCLNNKPFVIAVCDFNALKMINDTKGHMAGDEYIISSAKFLCNIFDHSPVFRIGGDEFAIFLSGQDYDSRKKLIENLHTIALKNCDRHEGPISVVGIAEYDPAGDSNVDGIFERADNMMYEDKRELKRAWHFDCRRQ